MKRATYLGDLRKLIIKHGSDNIIYFDESGFETDVKRDAGWAERGRKIYQDVRGKQNPRTNLIMAQRRKSKKWLAPILFQGSCESATVLWWMKEHLLPCLTHPSVIVMDNAPFIQKERSGRCWKKTDTRSYLSPNTHQTSTLLRTHFLP